NLRLYIAKCFSKAQKGSNAKPRLYDAMRKYNAMSMWRAYWLSPMLPTDSLAFDCERQLVNLFGTRDPNIGYNVAEGGIGFIRGQRPSRDTEFSKKWLTDQLSRKPDFLIKRGQAIRDAKSSVLIAYPCGTCGSAITLTESRLKWKLSQ